MKKYKLINALLAVCLMFTACQELTEPTYTDIPTVGTRDAENITNRTAKFISIDRDVKYKVSLSETFDEFQEYTLDEYSNVQREYYKEVNGFKGHLIINLESYAWIDIGKNGIAVSNDYIPIKNHKKDKYYKMMNKKSIYDVEIKSRDDLVYLMHHVKNSKDYSIVILTDCVRKSKNDFRFAK